MTDLIKFVDDDVQKIESNIVTTYEALAGYTLYPGDPREAIFTSFGSNNSSSKEFD